MKGLSAAGLPVLTATPALAADGNLWLRSDEERLHHQVGGVVVPNGPACPTPFMSSGYWYRPQSGPPTTQAMTLSRGYATPFMVPRKLTISNLAVAITVAATAGGVIRLGFYDSLSTGLPGTRLLDVGTVISTAISTGIVLAVTGSPTFHPGVLYWWVAAAQVAACTMRARQTDDQLLPDTVTTPALGSNSSSLYTDTGFAGAFPTPFGTTAAAGATAGPEIMFKIT